MSATSKESACMICSKLFATCDIGNASLTAERERLKRFFTFLERYLDYDGKRFRLGREGSRNAFPIEDLINAGVLSCEQCSKHVESFCQLYHEMKAIELLLNWKVRKLKNIMLLAQKFPTRINKFMDNVKQLDIDISGDEIIDFNGDLIKKCTRQVKKSFPLLRLNKCKPPEKLKGSNTNIKRKHSQIDPNPTEPSFPGTKIFIVEQVQVQDASTPSNIDADHNDDPLGDLETESNEICPDVASASGRCIKRESNESDMDLEATCPNPDASFDFDGERISTVESQDDTCVAVMLECDICHLKVTDLSTHLYTDHFKSENGRVIPKDLPIPSSSSSVPGKQSHLNQLEDLVQGMRSETNAKITNPLPVQIHPTRNVLRLDPNDVSIHPSSVPCRSPDKQPNLNLIENLIEGMQPTANNRGNNPPPVQNDTSNWSKQAQQLHSKYLSIPSSSKACKSSQGQPHLNLIENLVQGMKPDDVNKKVPKPPPPDVHFGRPFLCMYCLKTFSSPSTRDMHMQLYCPTRKEFPS